MIRIQDLQARLRGLSVGDWAFFAAIGSYAVAVVLPLWSTRLLPFMDYPMLLSFVRVFQDYDDPASPLYGIYTLGPPFSPLVLPITLTSALSHLGSIELGGRLMWTLYALGLPAAGSWLIRTLGLSRWNVVLVFPFVFSKWLNSGFFGFTTGLPLVLVAYTLAIRWLDTRQLKWGIGLTAVGVALQLWHALMMAQAMLGLLVIWLSWRATKVRDRFAVVWPLAPALVLFAAWFLAAYASKGSTPPPKPLIHWDPLPQALDAQFFFSRLLMLYPGAEIYAKVLTLAAVTILVLGSRERPAAKPNWRVQNPIAILALVALLCFFALPAHALGVAIINHRFGWLACVLAGVAWRWPARRAAKIASITGFVVIGGTYLLDVNQRFRAFHFETIGASRLIDSIPERASLIAPLTDLETKAIGNKAVREIQQYATIRKGGVPTSSFAVYGMNFVRYAKGVNSNPRVHFYAHNFLRHPRLREFDYVLLRDPPPGGHSWPGLRHVREDRGWHLYAVCGSNLFPHC